MRDCPDYRKLCLLVLSAVCVSSLFAVNLFSSVLLAHQIGAFPNVAILTLQDSALGSIEEGQTICYTPANKTDLDDAMRVSTVKAMVYLHLDSNLDNLSGNYDTYDIVVRFDTLPEGSSHSTGDTACTLSLASPDCSSIELDVAGSWTFDFEITTTAKSVSADQVTTAVTIAVSAKSA